MMDRCILQKKKEGMCASHASFPHLFPHLLIFDEIIGVVFDFAKNKKLV